MSSVPTDCLRGPLPNAKLSILHAHALSEEDPAISAIELIPAQPGFLILITDFFSPAECDNLIHAIESVELSPSTAADRQPRKNEVSHVQS